MPYDNAKMSRSSPDTNAAGTPPGLTLDEDVIRAEIRRELERKEQENRREHRREDPESRRRQESRLRARLQREEEERFYQAHGYVRYLNRYGQTEWLKPDEARRRKQSRRREFWHTLWRGGHTPLRWRRYAVGLAIGLALLLAVAVTIYALSRRPARYGAVAVDSSIPGALIYVDGVATEYITPHEIPGVPEGRRVLSVARDGFVGRPAAMAVQVTAHGVATARFELVGLPSLGSVQIDTNLQVAFKLFVDGLPTVLDDQRQALIPVGYHVLTPVCAGYLATPAYRRVLVAREQPLRLEFQFTAVRDLGYLEVLPDPAAAGQYVYLDGKFSGFPAAGGPIPLKPGSYEVEIPRNGWQCDPMRQVVAILPERTHVLHFRVTPLAKGRTVKITAREPGTNVILDGEWLPWVTPLADLALSPGDHFINLHRDGKFLAAHDLKLDPATDGKGLAHFDF